MKITKCKYNWDTTMVELHYSNGMTISLSCQDIENDTECSNSAKGKLKALKFEKPLEYAKMVFDGTLFDYCRSIDRQSATRETVIFEQYRRRYPDMSVEQIKSLVRESLMYEN